MTSNVLKDSGSDAFISSSLSPSSPNEKVYRRPSFVKPPKVDVTEVESIGEESSDHYSPPPREHTRPELRPRKASRKTIIVIVMSTLAILAFLVGSAFFPTVHAASTGLPAYPLAVKSPYLSAWLPTTYAHNVPAAQPQFWTGTSNLTWTVLARVNGRPYTLFGGASGIPGSSPATQQSITYTSSHTIINLAAGGANFTLDFFSTVLPASADFARQSLPYSYLTVSATSGQKTGAPANIQILSAIDSSWTAQGSTPQLNYTQTMNSSIFQFYNPEAVLFTEVDDMAAYGSIVFATNNNHATTYGCNSPSGMYGQFSRYGGLGGRTNYQGGPVCTGTNLAGLAMDLGNVKPQNPGSVTFAVGFDRINAIDYLNTTQTGYYRSQWPTIPQQVDFFLGDYKTALNQSKTFDAQVRSRATSLSTTWGPAYADIIEASVRQAFAASEITIPLSNMSTANPYIFLKEISSDGNVNTIDVIFPTFPIYLSLNPEYLKMVLEPVLHYLTYPVTSGGWPKNFAIHDIGAHYPNATGHPNGVEEDMPLYETSALFQMILAYQKFSGNTTWAVQYTSLLTGYGDYLIEKGLYPATQLISVDAIAATANQTGLSVQSAIGLQAAAVLLKNTTYSDTANHFVDVIYNQGVGLDSSSPDTSTHFTYNYNKTDTWGTLFPIYPDVLLNLTTFPSAAYEMEANFLLTQNKPAGLPFFGPYSYTTPLTGGGCDWSITDWTFWVAASVDNPTLQGSVVNATHAFLTNGMNTEPFGTKYTVEVPGVIGQWVGNRARSTVGANFALLTLEQGVWPKLY